MERKIKITLSEVNEKRVRIVAYLLVSGVLGYALSWVANKPELALVATPVINLVLYSLAEELKGEGYRAALSN